MWKQDAPVNSHDYWKNKEGSYGIWNDGGTGTSEDWVFGPLSNLGNDDGHFYSNNGTEYPWEAAAWYTGTASSDPEGQNSVEKIEGSEWKSTVERITTAISNLQGNSLFWVILLY